MRIIKLVIPPEHKLATFPEVKTVTIRRNVWDNYCAYVRRRKVLDGARKDDLIDQLREVYPNAEIIDKAN